MKKFFNIFLGILGLIYFLSSCEDEKYVSSTDAMLYFSADTVMFDQIFTQISSTTAHLKVYNPYDQKILISSIYLAGGDESNFSLNINGMGSDVTDLEIAPKDSIYIFVEATIDPNGQNLPMVVKDSIEFITNMNLQNVKLVAWGQDFNLIKGETITESTTWTNDKPYLIYDYAIVDSLSVLTIESGSKLYFHADAGLHIKGKLISNGNYENPVIMQGDRLENAYDDVPDQWSGVFLYSGSTGNELNYTEIKNANIGLQLGSPATKGYAAAKLSCTKIQNMAYAGILAFNSEITADNCLLANCGYYLTTLIGGSYEFFHSTFANYWGKYATSVRSTPSLIVSNQLIIDENNIVINDLNKATFANCIITGDISYLNELELGKSEEAKFNYKFDHCILQVNDTFDISNTTNFIDIQKNIDPLFVDPYKNYNFELDSLSPAQNVGKLEYAKLYPTDLNSNNHMYDGVPDLGSYERIEKQD